MEWPKMPTKKPSETLLDDAPLATSSDDMLRVKDVLRRTGMCRQTLYNKLRANAFPAPLEIGPNAIGWPTHEVDAWIQTRPRRTYGEAA
jgi:prophage regulatory protein